MLWNERLGSGNDILAIEGRNHCRVPLLRANLKCVFRQIGDGSLVRRDKHVVVTGLDSGVESIAAGSVRRVGCILFKTAIL